MGAFSPGSVCLIFLLLDFRCQIADSRATLRNKNRKIANRVMASRRRNSMNLFADVPVIVENRRAALLASSR
jgi:hypothetical protein